MSLSKCRFHRGISSQIHRASLAYLSHQSFASTTKQTKKKREIQLTDIPPTPWPPINPKLWDYEAQKGPQKPKPDLTNTRPMNVGALFLFGGVLCGAVISLFQPKDFRNSFEYYSCLPDAKYTKIERDAPLNIGETIDINKQIQKDQAAAMSFSLFCGFAGGISGYLWFRRWTFPLRIKQNNAFDLIETMKDLRLNSVRNCLKGTFCGSLGVLGLIYLSVFYGYLWNGSFYQNKYVDKKFWKFMELTYQKNIESRRMYMVNLEIQDYEKSKYFSIDPPTAPSMERFVQKSEDEKNAKKSVDESVKNDDFEYFDKEKAAMSKKREFQRKSFKKSIDEMQWNTDLYVQTKDIWYTKLSQEAKSARWNMSREMALLASSCAFYIVVPIMLGVNVISTRVYSNYWDALIKKMIKTKEMPLHTH